MKPVAWFKALKWQYRATAIFAVVSLASLALWWGTLPQVTTVPVQRRDFVQTVVASGHVESPHRVDIGSQITGTVLKVPVNEGDSVKANDVLVRLDDTELLAALRQADLAVVSAQARLRQLNEVQAPVAEQNRRQAKANLDNARSTLQRNRDLFRQGFIGSAALEDSRKGVELADAQLRSAEKQLESTQAEGSDYAIAQASVAEARATAEAAHARAKYAVIRAPLDGVLIGRNVEAGDVAQPGKVLMTLSPLGKTQIVVDIDEKNLRLIAIGQQALVSADAFAQQKFDAELVYINPGVNAQTGAVQVKLDVPHPPAYLRQDMTVSVDIAVARRPQTLVAPATLVHDRDSAAPWVMRVEGNRAVKVPVTLGLRGGNALELLQGVQEGDPLIPASAPVVAGSRVRLKSQTN